MSRSLVLSFQSASTKYSRLNKKIKKSIARGEFYRFTRRKRNYLLARIENLRRRLTELTSQIRIAGVGIAAAAILGATSADAQTAIGPFVDNPSKNPLPPPAFYNDLTFTNVNYHDFDKDGDLDAIVASDYKQFNYFENSGTKSVARFEAADLYTFDFSLPGPGSGYGLNAARSAFADLDDDGDLDMAATTFQSTYFDDPDPIYFFKNNAESGDHPYFQHLEDGVDSPFLGFEVQYGGWPSFADIDNDGDQDLIVSGYYYDKDTAGQAWFQYFRNDKSGHAAGVLPTFTQLRGENNPFYFATADSFGFIGNTLADIDGDGDQDLFYTGSDGVIHYKRNNNGTFVEQEGAWTYNSNNPGASTGNPFAIPGLGQLGAIDDYRSLSFADLDDDGDLDATLSINPALSSPGATPFIYFENTDHGTFTYSAFETNVLSGVDLGIMTSSTFFDYDDDGDDDIVALSTTFIGSGCGPGYCETQNSRVDLYVFLNNNNVFEPQGIALSTLPANIPTDGLLKLLDADGDGDLDMLVSRNGDGIRELLYYRNDDDTYVQQTGSDNPFFFVQDPADDPEFPRVRPDLADLNDDGLPDLILGVYNDNPLAYKNVGEIGAPVFTFEADWSEGLDAGTIFGVNTPNLVDLDNDGDLDLIMSKYDGTWYYENVGTRTVPKFEVNYSDLGGPPEEHQGNPFADINFGPAALNIADIDGDGDMDVLYSGYNGTFGFYENQNPTPVVTPGGSVTLSFTPGEPLTLGPQITLEDADNDNINRVDIHITTYQAGEEELQMNGTHGNLTADWDDVNGVLSITGNDTITVYQEALRNVQYLFTGKPGRQKPGRQNNGKIIAKTITFLPLDSDLTANTASPMVFTLSGDDGAGNGAPVISTNTRRSAAKGNTAFTFRQFLSDPDDNLDYSTLVITSEAGAGVDIDIPNEIVTIDYSVIPEFTGVDVITVNVCDTDGACSEATTFNVEVSAEIYIYSGMSPNDDDTNDYFQIDFLPEDTKVAIYNRWGDVVFETDNYSNDDASRRFGGKNKNGTDLVAGTYYYKVEQPGYKVKSGYILLNR